MNTGPCLTRHGSFKKAAIEAAFCVSRPDIFSKSKLTLSQILQKAVWHGDVEEIIVSS